MAWERLLGDENQWFRRSVDSIWPLQWAGRSGFGMTLGSSVGIGSIALAIGMRFSYKFLNGSAACSCALNIRCGMEVRSGMQPRRAGHDFSVDGRSPRVRGFNKHRGTSNATKLEVEGVSRI